MPPIKLSILIVNYNGIPYIEKCLESLSQLELISSEIIVVDNASTDNSVDFIANKFPEVKLVKSPDNLGFSAGNNLAARHASGQYFLLLNSDTVITSDISTIVAILECDKSIGALGCRMLYQSRQLQETIGLELSPARIVLSWTPLILLFEYFRRNLSRTNPAYKSSSYSCSWVSGAFILTSSEIWNKIGGLDESYFMYMEDVDFCRRLRIAGYKIIYTNLFEIVHLEGGGKLWLGKKALYDTIASYGIYTQKYYGLISMRILYVSLSVVFFSRASHLFFKNYLIHDKVISEKSLAYYGATKLILTNLIWRNKIT